MKKNLLLAALMLAAITATAQEAYTVFTSENATLTFYYDAQKASREGTVYNFEYEDRNPYKFYKWREHQHDIKHAAFDPSFANYRPTSTSCWFYAIQVMDITGMEYLNTSEVTDMSGMFYVCTNLTQIDVSHLNTSKVTDMRNMFSLCSSLESLDLSHFNTSNVTNMSGLFNGCGRLESLDLSSFDTRNVTDMSGMFMGMEDGYDRWGVTTLDVSHLNTSKVTNMSGMFAGSGHLTNLDLSNFDTRNVTDMSSMFERCYNLKSLDLKHFDTSNVIYMANMFNGCTSLENITCLATDLSALYCTGDWVADVAETGTFTCANSSVNWTEGEDGIPYGWTVENYEEDSQEP